MKRRRGVSKKSEKRKKRQDGKKKQIRKAPLSALGVLRRRNNPLAPRAAPSEHVLEPAEETSEALRAVGLGLRAPYPLLPTHSFLRTASYALLPSALLGVAILRAYPTFRELMAAKHSPLAGLVVRKSPLGEELAVALHRVLH